MTRAAGIVGVFVVALALAPISADAQALAAKEFRCARGTTITGEAPYYFTAGPGFGVSITITGSSPYNSITLKPAFYQLHIDGYDWPTGRSMDVKLNGSLVPGLEWLARFRGVIDGHDEILQVTGPVNSFSTLQFYDSGAIFNAEDSFPEGSCTLVITQLR